MSQRSIFTKIPNVKALKTFEGRPVLEFVLRSIGAQKSVKTSEEQRFFIGSPNFRTTWEVQTVSVTFSVLSKTENIKKVPGYSLNLVVKLYAGNIPIAVDVITLPFPESLEPGEKKEEKGATTYVLELFAPAGFSRAEPLEIGFATESKFEGNGEAVTGESQVLIRDATVTTILNQEFQHATARTA